MGLLLPTKRRRFGVCVTIRVGILLALLLVSFSLKEFNTQGQSGGGGGDHADVNPGRRLLNVPPLRHQPNHLRERAKVTPKSEEGEGEIKRDENATNSTDGFGSPAGNETEEKHCTEPAYHEFPPDLFTNQQRRDGALLLHLLVCVYMFVALAIVCDDYFVGSLEKISAELHLGNDVAGATFMAAGSSAPELFTSIIGVFVAGGDVGVGTIVGSAVFNILFVIGICGVLVTNVVALTWWPLLRDSVFYSMSVIILISSIADSWVSWFESCLMLILYAVYIVIMKYNPILQEKAQARFHMFGKPPVEDDTSAIIAPGAKPAYYGNYGPDTAKRFDPEQLGDTVKKPVPQYPASGQTMELQPVIPVDEYIRFSNRKLSFEDACFRFMKQRGFRPRSRFRAAVYIIISERRKLMRDPSFVLQRLKQDTYADRAELFLQNGDLPEDPEPDETDWRKIPTLDDGYWSCFKWGVLLPLNILLYYTIPNCKNSRWEKWYMATFGLAIGWIAVFSYIMVWMVALIGYTLGIPDSIMGITFLAAGTSVPDAMASVLVAKQGMGDMAISNTIGSNVFDICIGLALPWFIQTSMVKPGSYVHINSNGMVFSVILLFLTVIISVAGIHFVGWKLNRRLGYICLTSYAVFLMIAIMIEFNVFGYVNAPMCYEY